MDDRERPTAAANVPMSGGPGMSPSFGVAAPIGAVRTKDRERATRTALHREGPSRVALHTELPGRVSLQRRVSGATWETVQERRTWRRGRTRFDLSAGAPSQAYRLVFTPRNGNIPTWVSDAIDA